MYVYFTKTWNNSKPIASSLIFYYCCCKVSKIVEPRHDQTCLRKFSTRPDTNRPAQPQKLGRFLKFRLKNREILCYLRSEQQRRWSDCADAQADLRLSCSYMTQDTFSHGPALFNQYKKLQKNIMLNTKTYVSFFFFFLWLFIVSVCLLTE